MAQKHPASLFPLLLKPNGVLYADSFLLAPFQQGGASILLNLPPLIAEAGFQVRLGRLDDPRLPRGAASLDAG